MLTSLQKKVEEKTENRQTAHVPMTEKSPLPASATGATSSSPNYHMAVGAFKPAGKDAATRIK
jgi:hypothetical protein